MPNPAAVAFDAFNKALGLKGDWNTLPDDEKRAWFSVVGAVVKEIPKDDDWEPWFDPFHGG